MSQYIDGSVDVNDGAAPASPGAALAAGGSLADDTYYYVVTAFFSAGETVKSAEVNETTSGANNSVTISWTAVVGAVKYRVYRGTVSGTYTDYYEVTAPTVTFLDTGASATAGSPPATSSVAEIVIGIATLFSANVSAGDWFHRNGDLVTYSVASIQSDTQLTLSSVYAGANGTNLTYQIHRDFTVNRGYPIINPNDKDWVVPLQKMQVSVDADMKTSLGDDSVLNRSWRIRKVNAQVVWQPISNSVIVDTVTGTRYEMHDSGGLPIGFEPEPVPAITMKIEITNGQLVYADV